VGWRGETEQNGELDREPVIPRSTACPTQALDAATSVGLGVGLSRGRRQHEIERVDEELRVDTYRGRTPGLRLRTSGFDVSARKRMRGCADRDAVLQQ